MISISDFDVIYDERVYKCANMNLEFEASELKCGIDKPKFIDVVCINEDGNVILIRDESWRFRFVRKLNKEV